MKILILLKALAVSLYRSLKRFPAAIALSAAAAVLLIILTHNRPHFSKDLQEVLGRISMLLALGIPAAVFTRLVYERRNSSILNKALVHFLEAAALALYYFFFLKDYEMVTVTRYIGISLALYLAFILVPYFYARKGFELYVIKLFTRFCTTAIYSVVLFAGFSAIIFTLDKLLGIKFNERIYIEMWIGVALIFAPCFFLAGIPLYEEHFDTPDYPKLFKVLLLYIIMPLASVYTIILYIYFGKILVTFQWPIGMVAHLVIWYSVICAAVIFFISPLNNENRWARSFILLMPKLMIPLIIMMFVSIGIRVSAYGITENRYFVIALGIWALGVMIYLSIVGIKRNIVMFISLSLIAVLSVTGPWSSYPVSKYSQNKRLESILARNGMLQDGKVTKPAAEISKNDQGEISQIISYFSRSHKLSDIKYVPKDFEIGRMYEVFGFSYTESSGFPLEKHFSYNTDMTGKPYDITGYSSMFFIKSYNSYGSYKGNNIEIKYDNSSYEVVILSGGREVYRNSLTGMARKVYEKNGSSYNANPEDMSFEFENENIKVKFIFQNIFGYIDTARDEFKLTSADFLVLTELKK